MPTGARSQVVQTKTPPTWQLPQMFAISVPSHRLTCHSKLPTLNSLEHLKTKTACLRGTVGRGSCLLHIQGLSLFLTLNLQSVKVILSEHQMRSPSLLSLNRQGWRMVSIIMCNFCWHLHGLMGFFSNTTKFDLYVKLFECNKKQARFKNKVTKVDK